MSEEIPFLDEPADGPARLIDSADEWAQLCAAIAAHPGPIGFDAERAHGHRYHPRSYLYQLWAEGIGTRLIDPVALEATGQRDLSSLSTAVGDQDWVLHAASQDLPGMLMDEITPKSLFDTEMAARLLNLPKVGLAGLVEDIFAVRLRKAHSAADWSRRPLPPAWLTYAALDVEFLLPLRALLTAKLKEQGKLEWADQEFQHILVSALQPAPPAPDRWRRLKNLRDVRSRRGLAVAKSLWEERERLSAVSDRPPGRLLPDTGIVALAAKVGERGPLPGVADLRNVHEFSFRGARRYSLNWLRAIDEVGKWPTASLPPMRGLTTGVGQPRNWGRHYPEAAERWERVRPAIDALAAELDVPPANLIQPAALREVVFAPAADIDAQLAHHGARAWQRELVTELLAQLLH